MCDACRPFSAFLDPYLNLFTLERMTHLSVLSADGRSAACVIGKMRGSRRRTHRSWNQREQRLQPGRLCMCISLFQGLPVFLLLHRWFYMFKTDVVVHPGDRRPHLSAACARFPLHALPIINSKKSEVELWTTDMRKILLLVFVRLASFFARVHVFNISEITIFLCVFCASGRAACRLLRVDGVTRRVRICYKYFTHLAGG